MGRARQAPARPQRFQSSQSGESSDTRLGIVRLCRLLPATCRTARLAMEGRELRSACHAFRGMGYDRSDAVRPCECPQDVRRRPAGIAVANDVTVERPHTLKAASAIPASEPREDARGVLGLSHMGLDRSCQKHPRCAAAESVSCEGGYLRCLFGTRRRSDPARRKAASPLPVFGDADGRRWRPRTHWDELKRFEMHWERWRLGDAVRLVGANGSLCYNDVV